MTPTGVEHSLTSISSSSGYAFRDHPWDIVNSCG
jgi:hypothetical protein